MRKLSMIVAALGIFFLACVAFAAEKKEFPEFSIDLPDGWESPVEPQRSEHGVAAVFMSSKEGQIASVTVSFVSSMGKSMADLVSDSKKKMESQGVDLAISEQSDTRTVYTGEMMGMPLRMTCTLDPEAQKLGILVFMGQGDEAEKVARSIEPANPKLKFF